MMQQFSDILARGLWCLPYSPFLQEKMDILDGPHPGEDITNLLCVFHPVEKQSSEVSITQVEPLTRFTWQVLVVQLKTCAQRL